MKGAGKTTCLQGLQALAEGKKDWKAGDPDTTLTPKDVTIDLEGGGQVTITDTPGAQDLKRAWDEIVAGVDYVCYFYDITQLREKLELPGIPGKTFYYRAALADLRHLCDLCAEHDWKLLVAATHADRKYDKKQAEKYQSEMLKECPSLCKHIKCSLKNYAGMIRFAKELKEALEK